jgi:TM2 domain-containing membrane protein YozV
LLGQAIDNIGRVSREAAERRLRAHELATEKARLEFEAAKLAHEQHEQTTKQAPPIPAAVPPVPPVPSVALPGGRGGTGQVVVIHQPPVQRRSPGLAAVLSFLLPGLGQLYKGQIINGICWFLFVGLGYAALIVPGLILAFCCVLGALSGNPWSEGSTTVVREWIKQHVFCKVGISEVGHLASMFR